MHKQIAQLVFSEENISYALIDQSLVVRAVVGDPTILWDDEGAGPVLESGDEGLGRRLDDLLPLIGGNEEEIQALLCGDEEPLRFDTVNRTTAAGAMRYVNLSLRGYGWQEDGSRGLLLVARDVTAEGIVQQELMQRHNELRLLQERLERQNQELVATNAELRLMNEIRSSFISVAAHELRTPLTSIYGFLELLQESGIGNLNSEQREHLAWMEESAERLLNTLNELLDAARIDSDRLELVLRPVEMSEIVEEAVFKFGPRLAERDQEISVDFAPQLPQALCDPARIEQVVVHLLSNASKFTPKGGTVGLAVHPSDSGEFLDISVRDQGEGIANGEEDRLFQRFYREQNTRKTGVSGAGLGLYITRSLVELHGGQVWYDSVPGQGSTFHFTVPSVDEPASLFSTSAVSQVPQPLPSP